MTIYYRYWAQIQDLGPNQRVLISAGVLSIILFLILRFTYKMWRSGLYKLSMKLHIAGYLLLSNFYYDTLVAIKQSDGGRKIRERQNLFCEKRQKKYDKTEQAWQILKDGGKKYSFFWGMIIYLLLTTSIILPRHTKFYLPGISNISFAYYNIEYKSLEAAQSYDPFWKPESMEEVLETGLIEEAEQTMEENHTEIWLQLGEKGWNGSNIREEPDKNSGRITTVSGQVTMKQLELSEDGRWIRIELEDGTQGWINHTLVEVME